MDPSRSRTARFAAGLTRTTGCLLAGLGVIHLIATPFYVAWSRSALQPEQAPLVTAALRLNHLLVGVLLLPLAFSTFIAGGALRERWGFSLAIVNTAALLSMPILLVSTMPLAVLSAPLFRLAIGVLALACLTQALALGGVAIWDRGLLHPRKLG